MTVQINTITQTMKLLAVCCWLLAPRRLLLQHSLSLPGGGKLPLEVGDREALFRRVAGAAAWCWCQRAGARHCAQVQQRRHRGPPVRAVEAQLRACEAVQQTLALGRLQGVPKHDGPPARLGGQHALQPSGRPRAAGRLMQRHQVRAQVRRPQRGAQQARRGGQQHLVRRALRSSGGGAKGPAPAGHLFSEPLQRLHLPGAKENPQRRPQRYAADGVRVASGHLGLQLLQQDALVRSVLVHDHQHLGVAIRADSGHKLRVHLPHRRAAAAQHGARERARDGAPQRALPRHRQRR
mmetsp:Transcript_11609/g.29763  ORF Transcript_11609/g.29763 Transcript_11609/m.29763 type:complete len:294 (+) Transcript_11609:210-1091(+)